MKNIKLFFSSHGRLGRKKYFLYCIFLLSFALIVGACSDKPIFTWVIAVLYVLFIIQTIKRFHDLNLSGWWALLVLVPLVNLVMGAWALLKKGTKEKNKYDLN